MKKIVRTVWISALSGLAFMTACCTSKGLSKQERKQLVKERDSIQATLKAREGAAVYGSPEIIKAYGLETQRLRTQLDSINYKLGEDVDLEESARLYEQKKTSYEKEMKRLDLARRLETLLTTIREREGACVYGSPEIIEEYGRETRRMKQEAEKLQQELDDLDNPEGSKIDNGPIEVLYGAPIPDELR